MRRVTIALLVVSMAFLGGSSCLLDPVETPPEESSEETPTTTAAPTTAASLSPTTTAAATTTTAAATTTTLAAAEVAFPAQVIQDYLERVLTQEVAFSDSVQQIISISDDWDNRSETEVSYPDTEADMEEANEELQNARAQFDLIQAPPTANYPTRHLAVSSAVTQMAQAAEEMLAGLRSTDAGEQRQAAQVALRAAFGVFTQGVSDIIAEYIGNEEITTLIVSRDLTAIAPAASPTATTTTTRATTTTTAATTTTTTAPTTTTTAAPTTTTAATTTTTSPTDTKPDN